MSEACATAIEALHTLYDEGLIDNAAAQGTYLRMRLLGLKGRYHLHQSLNAVTILLSVILLHSATGRSRVSARSVRPDPLSLGQAPAQLLGCGVEPEMLFEVGQGVGL
jgi:acetylornithine/succinyldiaminopimelate/putrescine aminotransferase